MMFKSETCSSFCSLSRVMLNILLSIHKILAEMYKILKLHKEEKYFGKSEFPPSVKNMNSNISDLLILISRFPGFYFNCDILFSGIRNENSDIFLILDCVKFIKGSGFLLFLFFQIVPTFLLLFRCDSISRPDL